jgi:hypothetical protein
MIGRGAGRDLSGQPRRWRLQGHGKEKRVRILGTFYQFLLIVTNLILGISSLTGNLVYGNPALASISVPLMETSHVPHHVTVKTLIRTSKHAGKEELGFICTDILALL